jgi:hypothetical protein
MEQLETAANHRDTQPGDLLETAVRSYLRQMQREKIEMEIIAFRALHPDLVKAHLGEYVAIHEGAIVDHGADYHQMRLSWEETYSIA